MRILLDTHVLFWAVDDPTNLSGTAATLLQDPSNDPDRDAATIWEMAIEV